MGDRQVQDRDHRFNELANTERTALTGVKKELANKRMAGALGARSVTFKLRRSRAMLVTDAKLLPQLIRAANTERRADVFETLRAANGLALLDQRATG